MPFFPVSLTFSFVKVFQLILWIKFSCWEIYSNTTCSKSIYKIFLWRMFSKLSMKTPERRYWYCSCFLSGNFEHIQYIYLALFQVTLSMNLNVYFLCKPWYTMLWHIWRSFPFWFSYVFVVLTFNVYDMIV